MVELYLDIALSTLLIQYVAATAVGCNPLPLGQFQWLNTDGTLVNPQSTASNEVGARVGDDCCGPACSDTWRPLPQSPSCQFCARDAALVCQGSDVYNVPSPATLPATRLSLFKLSGVGLISIPPKSFMGLDIQKLVIEKTNISSFSLSTFTGVKSIGSLYIANNPLDYIYRADMLWKDMLSVQFLSFENNGLKVLDSAAPANLTNLTYFSLAGNPLQTLDVTFLQNSALTFLDLRNISFNVKNLEIKGSGWNKLPNTLKSIDLSYSYITTEAIDKFMSVMEVKTIKTLNLSHLRSPFESLYALQYTKNSLEYLSLKGTDASQAFDVGEIKILRSKSVQFVNMKELNLENCNIQTFTAEYLFPNLTMLSLAGNSNMLFHSNLISHMPKLIFIDFSSLMLDSFSYLKVESKNLRGVDFSSTTSFLHDTQLESFSQALKNVELISFCHADFGSESLISYLYLLSNLTYLDLTAVFLPLGISVVKEVFSNISKLPLKELHFGQNNVKLSDYPHLFSQLTLLESLDISNNSIRELSSDMLPRTLKTLDASHNSITTWYSPLLNIDSQLLSLDVSTNKITYISDAMVEDFYKLKYLSLDVNPIICHKKVVALVCANLNNNTAKLNDQSVSRISANQNSVNYTGTDVTKNNTVTLVGWQQYKCYDTYYNEFRQFSDEKDCFNFFEEESSTVDSVDPTKPHNNKMTIPTPSSRRISAWNWEWVYFIVGPIVLVSVIGSIVYLKWWNIRCFIHRYISLQKAHLLRKNGNLLAKPEVYHDVFVSYSDVDRPWVLDQLVPNMERDGDVSLCFHERDFQVGMTILENIIDCMDRSHALLLVVSSAFIYSKWCQFEMHLAQNRLIETFRDQLVLVLLEDIPRKMRPQTLHHLMMTKTYLMWPQEPCKDADYQLFWRRLKRAVRPNPNYTLPLEQNN